MGVQVLNREKLIERRIKNNVAQAVNIFEGSAQSNLNDKTPRTRTEGFTASIKEADWDNSRSKHELFESMAKDQKMINAANEPSAAALAGLFEKMILDITKRELASPDYTSEIATEITNLEFDRIVSTKDIYPYVGKFGVVSGANDSVPLIDQALGGTGSVTQVIRGLGWKSSIANYLFNPLYEIAKVNQAVVNANADMRNSLTIGAIVGASFAASQKQAADATAGATFDNKMYNTIRKSVKVLRGLLDMRTKRPIAVPRMTILCNSANTWDIERVIGGQLTSGGANGTLTTQNMQALPIANIIEYDQGLTNGFAWGKDTLSFPGVTAGTAYLFVPNEAFWVLNKRPLTMETGSGSVLELSREEKAWYRVQGEKSDIFFGTSGGFGTAGYGYIVEITLPTE